jgi:hypothetical protein
MMELRRMSLFVIISNYRIRFAYLSLIIKARIKRWAIIGLPSKEIRRNSA